MQPPTRAAVVGCGAISVHHLGFLSNSEHTQLVGVCDRSEAAARWSERRFGALASSTDVGELLRKTEPEVVHVLTPPLSHAVVAKQCLDAGAHVIVEKPITLDREDLLELKRMADASGRMLLESHNLRFNDQVRAIDQLIEARDLGEVVDVDVRLALDLHAPGPFSDENLPSALHGVPGGVLRDFLPHLVYLTLHFFRGRGLRTRCAVWSNLGPDGLFTVDDLDAILVTDDARGHGRLRVSSHQSPSAFELEVRGFKGSVTTDLYTPYLVTSTQRSVGPQLSPFVNMAGNGVALTRGALRTVKDRVLGPGPYHGLVRMLDEIYVSLHDGAPPPITWEEIDQTSLLTESLVAAPR